MKIERMGKSVVKVTIKGCELDEMGLTYKDISADSPLTVTLVSNLIRKIYSDDGSKSKLNIEIFPAPDSGCIMRISPRKDRKNLSRIIISVCSAEDLFKVLHVLLRNGITSPESCLTAEHGCLRLTADIPQNMARVCDELRKISRIYPADDIFLSYIFEHGDVIFAKDALSQIERLI